jgi:hypothetical protein
MQRHLQLLIVGNKKNDCTLLEWTEEATQAYSDFKKALANAALLAHPKEGAETVLYTDASDEVIGGALQQTDEEMLCLLAFFSHKLPEN